MREEFVEMNSVLLSGDHDVIVQKTTQLLSDMTDARLDLRRYELDAKNFEANIKANITPQGNNADQRKAYMERALYSETDPESGHPVYAIIQDNAREARNRLEVLENLWRLVKVSTRIREEYA